jgi:3-carboxy-cis,cis-muconate cycloisomerase
LSGRIDAGPFAHLDARGAVAEATTTDAWLRAMLDVEAALAGAQAAVGEIPAEVATWIADACTLADIDVAAVAASTERSGVPVIELVEQLRTAVGGDAAACVHRGATSQDIVDTAAMILASRAATIVATRLDDAVAGIDRLAGSGDDDTPMIGRTLGQYAVPTTFAAVTARWRSGLGEAAAALRQLAAALPVQLGGPVGDGASYGPRAGEIAAVVAARLGLVVPARPWSTMRTPIARIAGAWAIVATAVGDVATQLVALMASDVGELGERADGAGGSSSMAHKRNPVAAISARAAAMQLPGLIATLIHAAGGHDFERASGAWHGEWPALNALLRGGGAAVDWLATSLDRVVVDRERMAANLARADAERQR